MPLVVEEWPIARLVEYARNPRRNDEQIERMAGAIREFGFRIPIVSRSDGTVVDGHLRLKAARKLGLETVPVALADELSEAQIKAFRLLANRSASWAEWDSELLKIEFEELHLQRFDLGKTGFDPVEIERALDLPLPSVNAGALPSGGIPASDDPREEWQGMPEFKHEDLTSSHRVIVHFKSADALAAFATIVGQTITERTRFIWFPPIEIRRYGVAVQSEVSDLCDLQGEMGEPLHGEGARMDECPLQDRH